MTAATAKEAIKARCCMDGSCWVWQGAQAHGTPYIALRIDGRRVNVNAQKHMLALVGMKVPPGARVRETCGNAMCINPAHLEKIGALNVLKFSGNPFAQLLALAEMP